MPRGEKMGRKGRPEGIDVATIEKRRGGYRLVFWYRCQRYQGAVKATNAKDADQIKARVERNLQLLQEGRIDYKPGNNLFALMVSDGKLNAKPHIMRRVTLGEFFTEFQGNRPTSKECSTTSTEDIHIKHLLRLLGEKTAVADIDDAKLQEYIDSRKVEKNRHADPIKQITIKKELGTLSAIWNKWGLRQKLVPGPLLLRGLDFPKKDEQPPFQTWEQIERKTKDMNSDLWDSLFLSIRQVEALLVHVTNRGCVIRKRRRHLPYVFPMFAYVAYTGARRSEMLRAQVGDVEFARNEVVIREKKRDRSAKETYRHVPMVPPLRAALEQWLKIHPGGNSLFCKAPNKPITRAMASHYFRWAVDESKWAVIRGFHTLRHSLVSNLICQGVPERVVMGIVGHLNASTTRRYSHLFPSTVNLAMQSMLGRRKLAIAKAE